MPMCILFALSCFSVLPLLNCAYAKALKVCLISLPCCCSLQLAVSVEQLMYTVCSTSAIARDWTD